VSSPSSTSPLVLFKILSTSGIISLTPLNNSLPSAKVCLALLTSFNTVGSIDSLYSAIKSSNLELALVDKSLILLKILSTSDFLLSINLSISPAFSLLSTRTFLIFPSFSSVSLIVLISFSFIFCFSSSVKVVSSSTSSSSVFSVSSSVFSVSSSVVCLLLSTCLFSNCFKTPFNSFSTDSILSIASLTLSFIFCLIFLPSSKFTLADSISSISELISSAVPFAVFKSFFILGLISFNLSSASFKNVVVSSIVVRPLLKTSFASGIFF